ncbi:hypothetical protein EVAR_83018_1 [Eumeta japonica]|uniref:Uncharacterized protein n=1 Tax=Eumeta variegata TaxID=151549 RepID=A0A4C1T5M3_EUMVA|nr:hypothetical protein EVAR_83018_1 [Eumeta japonica]
MIRGQRRGSPRTDMCVSGREFTTNSASSSSVCSTSSFGALVCSVALKATFMDLTRRSQLPPICGACGYAQPSYRPSRRLVGHSLFYLQASSESSAAAPTKFVPWSLYSVSG